MQITLKVAGETLGTADWKNIPVKGDVIRLQASNGSTEVRSVDELEDNPSGGKVIHLGAARPTYLYNATG